MLPRVDMQEVRQLSSGSARVKQPQKLITSSIFSRVSSGQCGSRYYSRSPRSQQCLHPLPGLTVMLGRPQNSTEAPELFTAPWHQYYSIGRSDAAPYTVHTSYGIHILTYRMYVRIRMGTAPLGSEDGH